MTPTSAHVRGDMLLIGLTFGNQSDWSRNVRAAGQTMVFPDDASASAGSAYLSDPLELEHMLAG